MNFGFYLAAACIAAGCVAYALGNESFAYTLAFWGAGALLGATVSHIFIRIRERNSNGRHRKAAQAHRTGTDRGADDGTGTGGSSLGRTGASMNPYDSLYKRLGHTPALTALTTAHTHPAPQQAKVREPGEFDGNAAEFAAGVVTGTRSFAVDKLGRLTGVNFEVVWTPGENIAKCMRQSTSFSLGAFGTPSYKLEVVESDKPAHSIADCSHGFYGYYEGSNDYYAPGRVMGVVEAYGETVIGTRGFRASKARIIALHLPPELSKPERNLVTRNYTGIPTFDSFEAMVSEFPPDDAGNGLNPDTDPDFWTRKA